MFKNSYQSGLLSIFYSCGSNPLAIWESEVHNGHIKRITDKEVNSIVLEIVSVNVATTFITCPRRDMVLGIKLPFLVMIVKNLKRYFSFEITVLDDRNMRRRFRVSNFQSTTRIKPFCTSMPIGLSGGWNQIQFNLADFTRRAYGTQFMETLRVQVNANSRLRRIYFSDRLYLEDELPQEYKLFMPVEHKNKKVDKKSLAAKPSMAKAPVREVDEEKQEAVVVEMAPEIVDEAKPVIAVEEVQAVDIEESKQAGEEEVVAVENVEKEPEEVPVETEGTDQNPDEGVQESEKDIATPAQEITETVPEEG